MVTPIRSPNFERKSQGNLWGNKKSRGEGSYAEGGRHWEEIIDSQIGERKSTSIVRKKMRRRGIITSSSLEGVRAEPSDFT